MKRSRSPLNNNGRHDDSSREQDRSRRGDRPSRFGPRNSSPGGDRKPDQKADSDTRRIFISNIAYEYRWQELKDLFRNEVGEVSFVELFKDEHDKPRGCGIVEFAKPELVKIAIDKMHRYELHGRALVIKEDTGVVRDKYGHPMKSGGGGGGGGNAKVSKMSRDSTFEPRNNNNNNNNNNSGGGWDPPAPTPLPLVQSGGDGSQQNVWGNTYGLSPQFLEGLWITGPLVTRVFVANLDYKVDEKKLKEVFKMAGRVIRAELHFDKEGKSRGFGVIEYEHPVEAVQAISMFQNQMLFERRMTVRMDRVEHKAEGPPKLPEGLRSIGMGLGSNGAPLQDVARNIPSLVSPVPAAGAVSSLSSIMNPTLGLGTSLTGLPVGLGASSLLGGGSLLGAGGGDQGLLGGGSFGSTPSSFGFGRDFESLSAALTGGSLDVRGQQGSGSNFTDREFRSPVRNAVTASSLGSNAKSSSVQFDTVIVKNLPPNTTWQNLRDKFRFVGEVKYAEMHGKDVGIVRFVNEFDGQRAVHMMDRKRLDGRLIEVGLYF